MIVYSTEQASARAWKIYERFETLFDKYHSKREHLEVLLLNTKVELSSLAFVNKEIKDEVEMLIAECEAKMEGKAKKTTAK